MYDIYFTQKLRELKEGMEALEEKIKKEAQKKIDEAIATPDIPEAATAPNIHELSAIQMLLEAENMVEMAGYSTMLNAPITGYGLSTIIQEILEKDDKYHEKTIVDINSHKIDFEELRAAAYSWENMSLKAYVSSAKMYPNGILFDVRDSMVWQALDLKKGDAVHLYAQDLESFPGDKNRSYKAIHEGSDKHKGLAEIIGHEHEADTNEYVHRFKMNDESGKFHVRPAGVVAKAANTYDGDVTLYNPVSGVEVNAKSILTMMGQFVALSEKDGEWVELELRFQTGYDPKQSIKNLKESMKNATIDYKAL
ncbi:HPr family phosphocarrier protein [Candidatus Woesearchaeota archaeon]|nr:HPr family phosphocarrier protein [Candidatus Woesearchaeota archaeon]